MMRVITYSNTPQQKACAVKKGIIERNILWSERILVPLQKNKSERMKKILISLSAIMLWGCAEHKSTAPEPSIPDRSDYAKLYDKAVKAGDYDRAFQIIDSLETSGSVPEPLANAWRGDIYQYQEQTRTAEYYYKKALGSPDFRKDYPVDFVLASSDFGAILSTKGDIEGQLAVVTEAYAVARTMGGSDGIRNATRLLAQIGNCQLWLGHKEEAEKTFDQCYQTLLQQSTDEAEFLPADALAGILNNIVVEYNNAYDVSGSELWLQRMSEAVEKAIAYPDCPANRADELQARLTVNRAIILAIKHQRSEADKAYHQFLTYDYAKTDNGLIDKAVYFETAERWDDLERLQTTLDSLDKAQGVPLSMEYLKSNLGSRFVAELKSGRKQKALITAEHIVEMLDTIDKIQRKNDATELAIIYETQEKEAEIAKQQTQIAEQNAALTMQRLIGTAIALLLLTVFFIVYTLLRRRAAKRLAEANAIRERIESELRIARDIQMSMVPNAFPQRPDIDLYAWMEPAKEVGGDLYNYLIQNGELYFCVGDVSGKGVPASLFMAQATRLFRTLAAQGMMPADIATQMNKALTEDNEQGMFITMFIGLANLSTGRLDFCNAGHNPPVLSGQFLEMVPNAPIGLWPELAFEGETLESIHDRTLFIYTDGLNEAENERKEQFGDERLLHILRTTPFDSARMVVETLKAETDRHRNGAEPNDDLTMMCLRVRPQ